MGRPRKQTRDIWLDEFSDMDLATQEALLSDAALIHRQARRRTLKRRDDNEAVEHRAEQASLMGLPDEDQG
jgi:hypothetical protein